MHTQFQAVLSSPVDKSESPAILREELRHMQQNLASWQESWRQAKSACEAWKKEVEDVTGRARLEREAGIRRIEEVGGPRLPFFVAHFSVTRKCVQISVHEERGEEERRGGRCFFNSKGTGASCLERRGTGGREGGRECDK